jgi:spore germination protein GerM
MKNKYESPIQREILIVYAIAFLTAIAGTAWWNWTHPVTNPNSHLPANSSQVQGISKVRSSTNPQLAETVKVPIAANTQTGKNPSTVNSGINRVQPQLYWLQTERGNIKLIPQKITIARGTSPKNMLTQALNMLLNTPPKLNLNQAFTTTIPAETRLLNLELNDSEVHINLSKEFTTGGGSTSMIYRVAQIVYTASSINPSHKIYLSVEGELLDENYPLGGEGLVFREPVTRQQLVEDFSIN